MLGSELIYDNGGLGSVTRTPWLQRAWRKLNKRVGRAFGWPNSADEPGSFDSPNFCFPRTWMSKALWAVLPRLPGSRHWMPLLPAAARKKAESLRLIQASGLLDTAWYAQRHPEVTTGNWTVAEHYFDVGARNGFAPSSRFDGTLYTMLHPEIVEQRINPLVHRMTAGTVVPERLDRGAGQQLRCCVLLHLFYVELWDELAAYLSSLDGTRFTLLINIAEPVATPDLLRRIEQRFPNALVVVSPNRGRDIGGFFRLLSLVDLADHDVFMLVHSKRSPHCKQDMAEGWRHRLLNALLGSPEIVSENLALFATEPKIGGLAAASARRTDLGRNGTAYEMLLERVAVPTPLRGCEYVTGTMLMLRSSVLQRLYAPIADLQFEPGDNMPLDFHLDGQLAHAVERCIGAVLRATDLRMAWRPVPEVCNLAPASDPLAKARLADVPAYARV